jgi:hypothetical protein
MPAAAVFGELNRRLADPSDDAYRLLAELVESADSVHDALVATGVLSSLGPDAVDEANAVAGAIPPAVDEAIMGALESAFERAVAVTLTWAEGERIAVSVSEQPHGVSIQFVSPDGRSYV